jgi:hypothetical protein
MSKAASKDIPIPAVLESRRLFARFLTGWTSDALRLRASGLDRPSARRGTRLAINPGTTSPGAHDPAFLALYRADSPRWIPPASAKAA